MRQMSSFAIASLALCTAGQSAPNAEKDPSTGTAQAKLTFADDGQVRSCTITKSTANAQLDRKICDIMRSCVAKVKGLPAERLDQCKTPLPTAKPEN